MLSLKRELCLGPGAELRVQPSYPQRNPVSKSLGTLRLQEPAIRTQREQHVGLC